MTIIRSPSALGRIVGGMIRDDAPSTLLAVCPNSRAVALAALRACNDLDTPAIFAATLNQVDLDGGYTGWTPAEFSTFVDEEATRLGLVVPVYIGLDHGGPWTKDVHRAEGLSFDETFEAAKDSISACLDAGYSLLHIDATIDIRLTGEVELADVVSRTVELITHAENHRTRNALDAVAYEVGTEEVHGGMADTDRFKSFVHDLEVSLEASGLSAVWPVFFVGRVGTDLHTSHFDVEAATRLADLVRPYGSAIKGHYTDYVDNPSDYPLARMGGANVGPEFADVEVAALGQLGLMERRNGRDSGFDATLRDAVVRSGRWRKWLTPDERGADFGALAPDRQAWLIRTGSRYVWTDPEVVAARAELYANVSDDVDPGDFVVSAIVRRISHYLEAFNLVGFAARYPA